MKFYMYMYMYMYMLTCCTKVRDHMIQVSHV